MEYAIQTQFQYTEQDHIIVEANNEKYKTGLWDTVEWTRKPLGPEAHRPTEDDHKRLLRDNLTSAMPNLTKDERENFVNEARKTNEDDRKDFVMLRKEFDDWWEKNKKGLFSLAQHTIHDWDSADDEDVSAGAKTQL